MTLGKQCAGARDEDEETAGVCAQERRRSVGRAIISSRDTAETRNPVPGEFVLFRKVHTHRSLQNDE